LFINNSYFFNIICLLIDQIEPHVFVHILTRLVLPFHGQQENTVSGRLQVINRYWYIFSLYMWQSCQDNTQQVAMYTMVRRFVLACTGIEAATSKLYCSYKTMVGPHWFAMVWWWSKYFLQ